MPDSLRTIDAERLAHVSGGNGYQLVPGSSPFMLDGQMVAHVIGAGVPVPWPPPRHLQR